MPLTLVTVPCLTDNYAYLVHEPGTGATAAVDVPDPAPILAALQARDWRLSDILITHHHDDHIQGVAALVAATGARVTGAAADAHRLPPLDRAVGDGDTVMVGTERGTVIDVPGHTVGHIAFHFPASGLVFTADSLMAMGCGRLFEGTAAQMWSSLSRLAALPPDTLVCSGHEYTAGNARFAMTIEPDNGDLISRRAAIDAARARGVGTVPARLDAELATNPFLRADTAGVRRAVGMPDAPAWEVFAEVRRRKDSFTG